MGIYQERSPTMTAELRNWKIYPGSNTYLGPFRFPYTVVSGNIFFDTKRRWKDGHRILTSKVVGIYDYDTYIHIRTANSLYFLLKSEARKEMDHA